MMTSSARDIGSIVRQRRNALRMSQRALALAAEVSPTTINHVEMGTRAAHPGTEVAIAQALDWPPDAFDQIRSGVDPDDLPTIERPEMTLVQVAQLQAVLDEVRALRRLVQDLAIDRESPR